MFTTFEPAGFCQSGCSFGSIFQWFSDQDQFTTKDFDPLHSILVKGVLKRVRTLYAGRDPRE